MIIGISGKIGTGKSTLARLFCERVAGWERLAFADPLKDECARRFYFPVQWAYSQRGKEKAVRVHAEDMHWLGLPPDPRGRMVMVREILQMRGQHARAQGPQYWVRLFDSQARMLGGNILCDDVRYPSEADYIRRAGGFLVRVQPYHGWQPGPHGWHESETALDDYVGFDLTLAPAHGQLSDAAELLADLAVGLC